MQRLFARLSMLFASLAFFALILSPLAHAQGRNADARLVLDFVTDLNDSQTASTIETDPQFFQEGDETFFACTLVLQGAVDLMGVSCNIHFDNAVLRVDDVFEIPGDLNFDGRSNIADVLTIGERLGLNVAQNPEYALFDLAGTGVIDRNDIGVLQNYLNLETIYWTQNPNTSNFEQIRESVTLFEAPDVSNAKGMIEDLASVLLRRPDTPIEGFGFTGDARVATIVFQVVGGQSGQETVISIENAVVLDEGTVVNPDGSLSNESRPEAAQVVVVLP